MPNLTADKEEVADAVDSREDVDALLEEAFDYKREAMQKRRKVEEATAGLREKKEEIEEDIAEIEDQHADFIERREKAIQTRKIVIIEWALENEEEVLGDVDGRTYDTTFGEVAFTKVPFNFEWTDKDAVVKALKQLGREDLVRVEEKQPYKSDLKKEPDLVRRLDGVEPIEEHDEVSVELKIG